MNGRFTELLLTFVFLFLVGMNIMLVKWNADASTIGWARALADGFGGALLMALRTDISNFLGLTKANGGSNAETIKATNAPSASVTILPLK